MMYEYIYMDQRGVSVPEFMEKLNEYGEEGYHLVHQGTFGIFLLERQVYPEISAATSTGVYKPWYTDPVLFLLLGFILVVVLSVAARDFHWV